MRYLSVLEYEDGERVIRLGKENVTGSDTFLKDGSLEDAERKHYERPLLYRLPEDISEDRVQEELEKGFDRDDRPEWLPSWLKDAVLKNRDSDAEEGDS